MTNWEKYFGTPEKAARMDVSLWLGEGATVRCYGASRAGGAAPVLREMSVEDYGKWLAEEADRG